MRQPMHLYAPEDEKPHSTLQPLLAHYLPMLGRQRLSVCHGGLPGLLPPSIVHGIAQHQHGVDVLSTPAHACSFEACFDNQFIGAFHTA